MSSPSDKVWIFVKGRRSFKWKGSDLCPFHKSKLLLLSKGRCQKLRRPNPFWSVAYCKKTVKLTQWTVVFPVQHPPPSSLLTLLLWHLGKHLDRRAGPLPHPVPTEFPAGRPERGLSGGSACGEGAGCVPDQPALHRTAEAGPAWDPSMAPLLRPSAPPWASVPSKSAFQPSVKRRNPTSFQ